MTGLDFVQCGAITVICYLFGTIFKSAPNIKDEYIPSLVMIIGGVLGVVAMYTVSDFPASDILNAIATGIFSASFAVGLNQVIKQLGKLQDIEV